LCINLDFRTGGGVLYFLPFVQHGKTRHGPDFEMNAALGLSGFCKRKAVAINIDCELWFAVL
jgi:hypothetical protein